MADVRASTYSLALELPTLLQATQQTQALAGTSTPLPIEAIIELAAGQTPPTLSLDLRPLGQNEQIPLTHQGDGRYTLQTAIVAPISGSINLPLLLSSGDGQPDALFEIALQVFPSEDLAISEAPDWGLDATAEVEQSPFDGQPALKLPNRVTLTYTPEMPIDLLGYQTLRFSLHPDQAEDFVTNRLSLTANGTNTVLYPESGLGIGLDLEQPQWQTVDIPLAALGLTPSDSFAGFSLSVNMRGQTRLADIRLVAAEVEIEVTAVLETHLDSQPQNFTLDQNYPNPFNSGTVIPFALPQGQDIELAVYNLAGQQVLKLVEGFRAAGRYNVSWDGRDQAGKTLASGLYLYRLEIGNQVETRKLLLLR